MLNKFQINYRRNSHFLAKLVFKEIVEAISKLITNEVSLDIYEGILQELPSKVLNIFSKKYFQKIHKTSRTNFKCITGEIHEGIAERKKKGRLIPEGISEGILMGKKWKKSWNESNVALRQVGREFFSEFPKSAKGNKPSWNNSNKFINSQYQKSYKLWWNVFFRGSLFWLQSFSRDFLIKFEVIYHKYWSKLKFGYTNLSTNQFKAPIRACLSTM